LSAYFVILYEWQIDPVLDAKRGDGELKGFGNLDDEDEGKEKVAVDEVVMTTQYTSQCVRGMAGDLKKEMRSEAYEDVGLVWD
jgi:hypothetical protein